MFIDRNLLTFPNIFLLIQNKYNIVQWKHSGLIDKFRSINIDLSIFFLLPISQQKNFGNSPTDPSTEDHSRYACLIFSGMHQFTKVRFTKISFHKCSFHKKFISQKIYKVLFIDKLIN